METEGRQRAYSKKHRVYILREFLLATYGDYLAAGCVVLDVAGGKGDLSWLLTNVDDMRSIVIDPRVTVNHIERSVDFLRAHPEECRIRSIPFRSTYQAIAALMPKLEKKGYETREPEHLRLFVDQKLVDAVEAVVKGESSCASLKAWREYWDCAYAETEGFVTPTGKNDFTIGDTTMDTTNTISDSVAALNLILRARLVVGFHPDQATDYCFLLAKVLNIPVCVVPCCVFPSEFLHRRIIRGNNDRHNHNNNGEHKVKRYDDLIQYLQQEHPKVETAMLDFPGTTTARNTVLYTLPTEGS